MTIDSLAGMSAAGIQKLIDKDAISEIIYRYCRAVDRCDVEAHKACYWPDSKDDHGFFAGNGVEFCEYVVPVLKEAHSSIHSISNIIVDFEGDRAFVESRWSVIHRLEDGDEFLDWWHQGRYLDIFQKRDGEWRILLRKTVKDMDRLLRTHDFAVVTERQDPTRVPGTGRGTLGARYPDDPVYLGFDLARIVTEREPVQEFWGMFRRIKDDMTVR